MKDRTTVPAGGSRIEHRLERRLARLVVAGALVSLGVGTLAGSSPGWPDPEVYAAAAFAVAALWVCSTLHPRRLAIEVADASLLALGLIRASGYTLDLLRTGNTRLLAAVAAWLIVVVIVARPIRHPPT